MAAGWADLKGEGEQEAQINHGHTRIIKLQRVLGVPKRIAEND